MADHAAEPLEAVLRRLKVERDQADARYNAALTAVDRAIHQAAPIPQPPPTLDDHQIAALNDAWNILPAPPTGAGLRQRAAGFIWRVIGPYLQRQLTFNSLLVDHLNRNAVAAREAHRTAEVTVDTVRDQLAALAEFEARLLQYLQQITEYVDTKDRDTAGASLVLNASISGLADSVAKRWESMLAREQRVHTQVDALTAAQDDLRSTVGTLQQGFMTIKRELERLATVAPDAAVASGSRPSAGSGRPELVEIPDPGSRIPASVSPRLLLRPWTPTNMSASRIASAALATRSVSACRHISHSSKAEAWCSTSDVDGVSFSISWLHARFPPAASI